jgi:glucose-6-phosphate isomerase
MNQLLTRSLPDLHLSLPQPLAAAVEAALERARREHWVERLFDRDPSLWSTDPAVQLAISGRLGWLDAPSRFSEETAALEAFGDAIRQAGFRAAIVAGMGGSSLAPHVLWRTFGPAEGWLEVRVLDSTDPAAVAALVDDLDPLSTLFIVASKSGTTTEPLAFQADAWERIRRALRDRGLHQNPGAFMVAITDPGKSLEAIPHHDELREVFLNPPDVGGRFSALTYVGLVPASLMGLDLDLLLASGAEMLARCREPDPAANPGAALGLTMGTLARLGRDKLTLIADPAVAALGAWLEQLIAESTGKHGTGIVPVDGEPLGPASVYGSDRLFVALTLRGAEPARATDGTPADARLRELAEAGHPVVRIQLERAIDLGGEFVRWEVATALAGAVLGIDPFDQPNVEEAKEQTRRILAHRGSSEASEAVHEDEPLVREAGVALFGDAPLRLTADHQTLAGELARHLSRRPRQAYLALQAFVAPTPERDALLTRIRTLLRDRTTAATTVGYGPRFLHSTGQLHKGGPATGWFLQFTADHPQDRPIPGWPFSFGQLIDAQAAGDFRTLEAHDRPIARIHLGADPEEGLAAVERALETALGPGDVR